MRAQANAQFEPTLGDMEMWAALGGGAALLVAGAARRSMPGVCLALASAPLIYRGLTGHWPSMSGTAADDTRSALAGTRGVHVREAVRIQQPIEDVYRFWRRLENLPRFMTHLESVTEHAPGRSQWVARGPVGLRVAWEAEIVNEVENKVIGWRSLAGSDIVTAGSVNFDRVRDGRTTQVTVRLQYSPPAGRTGAFLASIFGREPSQTIREDLRRFKQQLEAGEMARAGLTQQEAER